MRNTQFEKVSREIAESRISFRTRPSLKEALEIIALTRANQSVSNLIIEILESDARVHLVINKLIQ